MQPTVQNFDRDNSNHPHPSASPSRVNPKGSGHRSRIGAVEAGIPLISSPLEHSVDPAVAAYYPGICSTAVGRIVAAARLRHVIEVRAVLTIERGIIIARGYVNTRCTRTGTV
ncbi:MAG: hypothetical protein V3V32_03285, partial [Dehalococcoidia bacterium]